MLSIIHIYDSIVSWLVSLFSRKIKSAKEKKQTKKPRCIEGKSIGEEYGCHANQFKYCVDGRCRYHCNRYCECESRDAALLMADRCLDRLNLLPTHKNDK